jgi:hypothetical protein
MGYEPGLAVQFNDVDLDHGSGMLQRWGLPRKAWIDRLGKSTPNRAVYELIHPFLRPLAKSSNHAQ